MQWSRLKKMIEERICDRLADLYRERPVTVINAITRPKTSALEQFANAFRLKGPPE